MTESQQAQALNAAFPTEPVHPELHQRIENLTPLSPTVTGYKLKFRHVFAAFAVLWVGHNIPAAVQVWEKSLGGSAHIQYFGYTKSGKRTLTMDMWCNGFDLRIHYKDKTKNNKNINSIIIYKNNMKYTFDKDTKTLTLQKNIRRSNYQKLDSFFKVLTTTLLRTHDTRNFTEINGVPMVQSVFSHGHMTVTDPITGNTYSKDDQGRLTELTVFTSRLPDSLFEPNFPDVQNTIYLATEEDDSPSSLPLLSMIRVNAMDALKGEHP